MLGTSKDRVAKIGLEHRQRFDRRLIEEQRITKQAR
jgi:hypothetical protein